MKISHTIDIHRSPEDVFLWIGSPERAMVWMTSVSKTEFLQRTPDMIGTTFREVVADEKGSTELQGVVSDYRPNQRIAFHLHGPYKRTIGDRPPNRRGQARIYLGSNLFRRIPIDTDISKPQLVPSPVLIVRQCLG